MQHRKLTTIAAAMTAALQAGAPVLAAECTRNRPTTLDSAMYLLSKPQDAAGCVMRVVDGRIVIDPGVSNPAMTCPNMFSWKLFAEVVKAEFWKNWASDEQTWPSEPYALCREGQAPNTCCSPDSLNNPGNSLRLNPGIHCPFYPGDHQNESVHANAVRIGQPPSKLHVPSFMSRAMSTAKTVQGLSGVDPGRVLRQTNTELVQRNKPMVQYIFKNDLYNTQGLAAVYAGNADNVLHRPPYRKVSADGKLAEIDLPVNAVMIKSNWLWDKTARDLKLTENPAAPHIKMNIMVNTGDNKSPKWETRLFWLLSFHILSKDTPNWVWTTFEYQNNPGRCDYIGCNDSYGFASPDMVAPDQSRNFTAPKQQCDNLDQQSWIWQTGGQYAGGEIQAGLMQVFDAFGIGKQTADAGKIPTSADAGWRGYRLKGSQVNFTDSNGLPTHLANSVTEGGFVSTSSCIPCHARATLAAPDGHFPALGVFLYEADVTGYLQSAFGAPNPAWFIGNTPGSPPSVLGLQSDFVWGFFGATEVKQAPLFAPEVETDAPPIMGMRGFTQGETKRAK